MSVSSLWAEGVIGVLDLAIQYVERMETPLQSLTLCQATRVPRGEGDPSDWVEEYALFDTTKSSLDERNSFNFSGLLMENSLELKTLFAEVCNS